MLLVLYLAFCCFVVAGLGIIITHLYNKYTRKRQWSYFIASEEQQVIVATQDVEQLLYNTDWVEAECKSKWVN